MKIILSMDEVKEILSDVFRQAHHSKDPFEFEFSGLLKVSTSHASVVRDTLIDRIDSLDWGGSNKIKCIKILRCNIPNLGLKDAKDAIEMWEVGSLGNPSTREKLSQDPNSLGMISNVFVDCQ